MGSNILFIHAPKVKPIEVSGAWVIEVVGVTKEQFSIGLLVGILNVNFKKKHFKITFLIKKIIIFGSLRQCFSLFSEF